MSFLQFRLPFPMYQPEPHDDDPGPGTRRQAPAAGPAVDAVSTPRARRRAQFWRVSGKLFRLVQERPYAAGVVEHHIDRLLDGKEAA